MNTRKLMRLIMAFAGMAAFCVVFTLSATAKGNQAKGRYYFRKTCKNCHSKGDAGGEVTPLTKTMAQWKSYFAADKHTRRREPLTKVMPSEQLVDVGAYLVKHAADSLQPETCGK